MTDQINFPAIGDPPRLAEETAKADIINRVRTRDDRAGDPTTDLQPTFIGEITALCTDSGDDIARYEWKRIGVLDDGYETAYAEIGLAGAQTDEEYPPLIEVNRLGQGAGATPPGDDPQEPSYKVGDRVLVHRVASDGGDVYMCVTGEPWATSDDPLIMLPELADLSDMDWIPGDHEEADTWDRLDQGVNDGVTVRILVRFHEYQSLTLLQFFRDFTFDSQGKLVTISAEYMVSRVFNGF